MLCYLAGSLASCFMQKPSTPKRDLKIPTRSFKSTTEKSCQVIILCTEHRVCVVFFAFLLQINFPSFINRLPSVNIYVRRESQPAAFRHTHTKANKSNKRLFNTHSRVVVRFVLVTLPILATRARAQETAG